MARPTGDVVSAALVDILEAYDRKWEAMIHRMIAAAPSEQGPAATARFKAAETCNDQTCEKQIREWNEHVAKEGWREELSGRQDVHDKVQGRKDV